MSTLSFGEHYSDKEIVAEHEASRSWHRIDFLVNAKEDEGGSTQGPMCFLITKIGCSDSK